MFLLYEMTREVRIAPHDFGRGRVEAITDELNKELANRVMLNVGLCMSLWDIIEIKQGVIYPGDGGVHSLVKFRYIVFRPFQDEVIVGKIKNSTPSGIYVSLGFFDDIFIPRESLQHPSRFDKIKEIWIWEYKAEDDDEEEEEIHDLNMEKGDSIRIKITGEEFKDTTPVPAIPLPVAAEGANDELAEPVPSTSTAAMEQQQEEEEAATRKKAPFLLTASINEPGLGLMSWWS